MITVACVYRTGGIYSLDWVAALKRGLDEHLSDFRFAVLTDDPAVPAAWRVPLIHSWPGWWSKLELFRPGLFEGRVLYMDLDTLPVGDLTAIASYRGPLAMLSDFYRPDRPESGVMAWSGDECADLYATACRDIPDFSGRDGRWLAARTDPVRLQARFPEQLVSYKVHARDRMPKGARLVCAHGRPKFDHPDCRWAHDLWTDRLRPLAVAA